MRLVQYWHSATPPEEVAALIESWRRDPQLEHALFDREAAADFILHRYGARHRAAFDRCAVPAMQADFFRYCHLHAVGGAYVDADTENGGGLPALVGNASVGMLMRRHGNVANDFLFVREPGHPLFAEVIARAVENIEAARSNNVWEVTGPGIMTGLYNRSEAADLFAPFTFVPVEEVRRVVMFRWDLAYKSGQEDWRVALGGGASIYRD